LLDNYSLKIGTFANYYGAVFMVAICLKHVLEYSGILGSDQKNLAFKEQNPKLLDLGKILELLIITLSLVIAVIPEGL